MAGLGPRVAYRLLVACTLIGWALAFQAAPAGASCLEPPPLEEGYAQAEVVFVGRIIELTDNDRTAVVEVEEVWKGPDLPPTVTVHGGPQDPNVFTSVDRTFRVGAYVFFPVSWSSDLTEFEDNACTLTQLIGPALDVIAPDPAVSEPGDDPAATTVAVTEPDQPDTTVQPGTSSVPTAPSQPEDTQARNLAPVLAGVAGLLVAAGAVWWLRRDRTPVG